MTTYSPTFPPVRIPQRMTVIAAGLAACAVAGIALFANTTDTQTAAAPEVAVAESTASTAADLKTFSQGLQPAQVGSAAPGTGHLGGLDQRSVSEFAQANGLSGLSPASAAPISLPSIETTATAVRVGPGNFFLELNDAVPAAPVAEASTATVVARSNFASDADWINANGWGGEAVSAAAGTERLVLPRSIFASDADWINANGWANDTTTDQPETVQLDRGGPR